jgi:CelD/BcsL family acetyltransferase involved in cellulose biosynthesis
VNQACELVTEPLRMRALEPQLWALFQRDEHATPFQSPAWLLSWIECFAASDGLRSLILWQDGQARALVPLWLDRTPNGSVLKLVGAGVGDYLDGLVDASADPMPLLAGELCELMKGEGATIELADLRPDSPLLALAPWFRHHLQVQDTCPSLSIQGSFQDYLAARPLGLRRNLQRTQSHLGALGTVEFRRAEASNIKAFMETFLDLQAARWREKREANVLANRVVRRFHQAAAPGLLAHDLLELLALCLDGCPVAVAYVLRRREHFMYLTAFDPTLGQVSLGSAIIAECISRAFRMEAPRIDFLRGRERYKYDFGGCDRNSLRLVLEGAAPTDPQP